MECEVAGSNPPNPNPSCPRPRAEFRVNLKSRLKVGGPSAPS